MTEDIIKQRESSQVAWPKETIPEQRDGDVKDITGAVLFLTSRAGGYINGNVLIIDGGRLNVVPATY